MNSVVVTLWSTLTALAVRWSAAAQAEQRRATRLGNPATRFAPPIVTPDDLRARFGDERLKPDIAAILDQWGWRGNLEDLHRAALSNDIYEVNIGIGETMPFMASRKDGRPICLRNVLWAGTEPISALAFQFASNGRRYRCVTPKPCTNFYVEDLSLEPRSGLSLDCTAPGEAIVGRAVNVCLTVRNTGNVPEPNTTLTLPVPDGAVLTAATQGFSLTGRQVTWQVRSLAPNEGRQFCAVLTMAQPGSLSLNPTAVGANVGPVQSACETRVAGVPAILLEVVDLEDPVEVGTEVTYEIRVVNQGSAADSNIRIACLLPDSQEAVAGSGSTPVRAQGGTFVIESLPSLAPKATATWRVTVRALRAGDTRFKVELRSDQFERPITEEEATQQY